MPTKKTKNHRPWKSLDISFRKSSAPSSTSSSTPSSAASSKETLPILRVIHRANLRLHNHRSLFRKTQESMVEREFTEDSELGAYGNSDGLALLAEHDQIPQIMARLDQQTRDIAKLREDFQSMKDDHKQQTITIDLLKSVSPEYTSLQNRLFETFKRDLGKEAKKSVIQAGNELAHSGDVISDMAIFKSSSRTDTWVVTTIYGRTWDDLLRLTETPNPSMIKAINAYGTISLRLKNPQTGKILSEPIRNAYQAYIAAQLMDLKSDPANADPPTSLSSKYWNFLKTLKEK